jgi:hypothetical protein
MTDQEQDIAVAKACGWTFLPERDTHCGVMPECWESPDGERVQESPYPFPSYGTDLNAMHEAEKAAFQSSDLWFKFVFNLLEICGLSGCGELDGLCGLVQATAAQRREAFLRTIGKWRD